MADKTVLIGTVIK